MSSISKLLNQDSSRLDISRLTKRGIKRVLITPRKDVSFDNMSLLTNRDYDITFPELNGTLPSYIQVVSTATGWTCECRVMELAGKGNANYFSITKENDNGVPT